MLAVTLLADDALTYPAEVLADGQVVFYVGRRTGPGVGDHEAIVRVVLSRAEAEMFLLSLSDALGQLGEESS